MALAGSAAIGTAWLTGLHVQPTVALGAPAGVTLGATTTPKATANSTSQGTKPPKSSASKGSSASSGKRPASHRPATPVAPRSGSVDGPAVDTQYGAVQVRIIFSGKRITNVTALRLTDSSGTSVAISAGAAPILRQEALAAQSARIDVVSGATYTSEAYQQSLQAAIDAAHLA